jgi:hypothetical protein
MRTLGRILGCVAVSAAALVTTASPAAADALCGPAPSAPHVLAIYPGPTPGQMEVTWNPSEPCIGDGGTLQYDVYITIDSGTPTKVDHVFAGQPVYIRPYLPGFTSCHQMLLTVTVYAWSVNNANRSAPGDSPPVYNPQYAPESLCPGPLGS